VTRDRSAAWFLPVLIVAVAAALRFWQLDTVPLGLHNDEAWTGLNARQVLREGWIGPYLYPSGLGQPAGPVYFTALLFTVLPQTTFTLRLSMALFGVAAVAFTYLAVARMFDRTTALLAAAVLAVMPWHLHLSRTGFMVGAWPCVEMAILWALFRARAEPSVTRFAGVGLLIGLGVYTYNAYALFLPVVATPFVYDLIAADRRGGRRRWLTRSAVTVLTAVWAAGLMVDYAVHHQEYFWHFRDVSLVRHDSWVRADWAGRAAMIEARAAEWGTGLLRGGRPDHGDGLGERGHPLLDPFTAAAALAGIVVAARGWRRAACGVLLVALAVLPLGALLTIEDGLYRRTFGLAPFVATLAALPLAWLWAWARARRGVLGAALTAAVPLAVVVAGARNAYAYFGPLQRAPVIRAVYPYQIDAAARAVAGLPREAVVYLFSERWGAGFETVRWLAPEVEIVDRSREFRKGVDRRELVDLSAHPARPTVFVLLGRYLDLVDDLRARYPDAAVEDGARDGELLYRIVRVPAGENQHG